MTKNIVVLYSNLVNQTWKRMVKIVGVHTVIILTKRALWMTSQKYIEADSIRFDEEGIYFDALASNSDAQLMKAVMEEFFSSLVDILTRLVGRDMTRKLAVEIDALLEEEAEV